MNYQYLFNLIKLIFHSWRRMLREMADGEGYGRGTMTKGTVKGGPVVTLCLLTGEGNGCRLLGGVAGEGDGCGMLGGVAAGIGRNRGVVGCHGIGGWHGQLSRVIDQLLVGWGRERGVTASREGNGG